MKVNKFGVLISNIVLAILVVSCATSNSIMNSPSSESKESIPLYSNLKEIKLADEDKRLFVTDVLGYEYLLNASTTNISWSEDTGDEVMQQLDSKLPDDKWRLVSDWGNWVGFGDVVASNWRKGDLELAVVILDNLSSESINSLNKRFGISDLTPGATLILSHVIDVSQPLPNTTATAQILSQNATATVDAANFSASATAETINNSIQATQSFQATSQANVLLQSQLEVLSEDFNSDQLPETWSVYRPDPTRWDLTSEPGFLHIVGSPERDAGILNIFGTKATYSDMEAIARVESHNMLDDGQSVWIAFTPEDYSEHAYTVELGISFDDYNGYRIYMWESDNEYGYTDTIGREDVDYKGSIFLKLSRIGKDYVGYYSYDGTSWIFVGEKKDFPVITDQITIGAGGSYSEEFDAYIDYLHFGVPKP